jgi:hypothetical protein
VKRKDAGGVRSAEAELAWIKRRFCSRSCSKKAENPMSKNQARIKMRETLRRIRHRPIRQGGNGRLLPIPQLALLHALGEGWESEVAIPTRIPKGNGYPTCYKLDIANAKMKIGIELDGETHAGEKIAIDRKKIDLLATFGWTVYRVKNSQAMKLYSTFESADTLLTLLKEFSSTTATTSTRPSPACTAP